MIRKFERLEEFEKCDALKKTIERSCKKHGIKLPTSYGKEAIEVMRKGMNSFGFSGDTALNNTPHYADKIECSMAGFL